MFLHAGLPPQRLEAAVDLARLTARVNSCPSHFLAHHRVFPQPVKPAFLAAANGTAEAVPHPKPFMRPVLSNFLHSVNPGAKYNSEFRCDGCALLIPFWAGAILARSLENARLQRPVRALPPKDHSDLWPITVARRAVEGRRVRPVRFVMIRNIFIRACKRADRVPMHFVVSLCILGLGMVAAEGALGQQKEA